MTALAVLIYPNIDPVAIELGPLSIKWYGIAYMTGLILGWLYIRRLITTPKLWYGGKAPFTLERVDDLLLYITAGVIIGGRLGQVLLYDPDFYFSNPAEIVKVWKGGMSFHGALIATGLLILLFARHYKVSARSVMDLCCAAAPIGIFFGRIANFINSEHWGRVTDAAIGMVFPNGGPDPRHPSQLYEAVLEGLVMFAIIRFATHRMLALKRPGLVAGIWLIWYAIARSISEIFREPEPGHILNIGPFTAGQVYCSADAAARHLSGVDRVPAGRLRKGNRVIVLPDPRRDTPLALQLKESIRRDGPMTVQAYMSRCLWDREHGYYRKPAVLGAAGDFITAAEISQVFGELIGVWAGVVWQGVFQSPNPITIAEYGPGRGTMMRDALHAARVVPGFASAARVHLVEASAASGRAAECDVGRFSRQPHARAANSMPSPRRRSSLPTSSSTPGPSPSGSRQPRDGASRASCSTADGNLQFGPIDGDCPRDAFEALLPDAPPGAVIETQRLDQFADAFRIWRGEARLHC